MAIISASRRTDIPAFFPEWFMKRIREGYFCRVNPFNSKQVKNISLKPHDVDAIVFWSKNPRQLLEYLPELDDLGLRYYFQFTLNPYGALFEPHLPPLEERAATFRELAAMIGPEKVIWRYDPVILSNVTPVEYHIRQMERLAEQLEGMTSRLMFSFLDFYGKAERRIKALELKQGIIISDISSPGHAHELRTLLASVGRIAENRGIKPYSCAEDADFGEFGIGRGSCIDDELIRELFAVSATGRKDRHQREKCGCVESVDMGAYNTCGFQCVYCYANMSEKITAANLKKHGPDSPSMLPAAPGTSSPAQSGDRRAWHCAGQLRLNPARD